MSKIALFILCLIASLVGTKVYAQDIEVYLKAENSDPVGFAVLSVVGSDEFFISSQEGRLLLPQSVEGANVKISHLAFRDTTITLKSPFPMEIFLTYQYTDLAQLDVTPIDDKKLFQNAISKLKKDVWNQPSVNMGYFQVQLLDEKQELISVDQAFGVYIFQELLNRTKGNNEWIMGGYNGFYMQEKRSYVRQDFEEYFPNPATNSFFEKEIFGYLNDVFVIVDNWKVKEAYESYASNNQYFYVFNYNEDGYNFNVHVAEESEQVHHIEITRLRNPGKRNRIQFSGPSYFRIDFGYDGEQAFIANLDYRGNPLKNPTCELLIGMEITKRGASWSLERKADFEKFFKALSNRKVLYNEEFWNHPSTQYRLTKGISADLMDVPFHTYNEINANENSSETKPNTEDEPTKEELALIKPREEYRKSMNEFAKFMENELRGLGAWHIIQKK